MKKLILSALFLLPLSALFAQAPDCQFAVTFTGPGRQGTAAAPAAPTAFPALSAATGTPCNNWRVSYQTLGSVTVSLSFQGVNDVGLLPGSTFTTMGPACPATNPCTITLGTNPMTDPQNGFLSVIGYFPWVSLLMNTCGGCSASNTVQVKIMGYRSGVRASGGGTITGPVTTMVGLIPTWANTTGTALGPGLGVSSGCGSAGQVVTSGGSFAVPTNTISPNCMSAVRTLAGTTRTVGAQSEIFICTGACSVTPLALTAGQAGTQLCVQNDDNVATIITLAAIATMAYENTSRTSYKAVNTPLASSGAVGDQICIVGRDSGHYNVFSFVGTWN